jgi:hypothetical protein
MKLFKDERGIAMVSAMLVTLVVTSLAATGFALATHNSQQSGNDRRRVDSIAAAEAGIDAYLQYIATAPTTGTACSLPNGTLTATPPATYVVSATYYTGTDAATQIPCSGGVLSGSTAPGAILIHSVGTAAGRSRTMEAWYGLVPNSTVTTAFTGAVYSYKDATFSGGSAQFSSNTHQGNLYAETGNINLSGSSLIDGVIAARAGTVTLSGSAQGLGDVTAYSTLATSGGVIIWGNGRSSMGANNNGAIIKGTEYWCSSKQGVGLAGTTKECNSTLPTDQGGFPYFSWTDFQANNAKFHEGAYTIQSFNTGSNNDCTNAHNYIMTGPTGNNAVYIGTNCTLNFPGGAIPVNGNIAVVSVGSLNLSGGSYFNPPNSNTGFHLRLEFNINSTAPACTSNGIAFSGGSSTGAGVQAELRTPCYANFSGGSFSGTGSVLAGNVNFSGGSSINAMPSEDGTHIVNGSGFIEKFQYRREIIG